MAVQAEETQKPNSIQLLERRVRELTTLHEIARAVTSVLELDPVLHRIVEASVYLTNAAEGFLLLVDEESGELTLRAGKGLGEKASRVMSIEVDDSIAGQVIETGRPLRMGGFRHDEEYKVKTGYLVKSLVNVPIKSRDQVIGVLAVDHSTASMRSFSDHDVALLLSLANYAAIAIQNAHLFAETAARADELAKALEEQANATSVAFSDDQERLALEKFAQGLRGQREEVLHGIESARRLARDLQAQAQDAEEMARRLGLWDEEMRGLLPQLEWLTQAGLPSALQASASPTEAGPVPAASTSLRALSFDSQLLQHIAEGALLCDSMGFVRQANQAAARLLDKPMTQLINSDLQVITDDPRWERWVGSMLLSLAMGSDGQHAAIPQETTLHVNDRIIHARLLPVDESKTGVFTSILILFRDISAELEGWRARDTSLAAVSRRLRGPMTAIASYTDLLLGDALGTADSIQRRYLQRIQQGVERLAAVLDELGEESVTSRRRIIAVAYDPVAKLINQALDAAQQVLSLDGVDIVRDISQSLPPVHIDAEYVRRVLADLLSAVGARTGVGESVSVSTEVHLESGQRGHLFVLIQGGDTGASDTPPLERDESIRAALALAEDAGCRVWTEHKADGSHLVCFLLPVAEDKSVDQGP